MLYVIGDHLFSICGKRGKQEIGPDASYYRGLYLLTFTTYFVQHQRLKATYAFSAHVLLAFFVVRLLIRNKGPAPGH